MRKKRGKGGYRGGSRTGGSVDYGSDERNVENVGECPKGSGSSSS